MKDFEAMKTGKSAIRPWLIFPYKENILLDLLSSMACVVSCPNRTKNLECYLTFKCVHPLACSRTKPAEGFVVEGLYKKLGQQAG